jgi:hypothetical protein
LIRAATENQPASYIRRLLCTLVPEYQIPPDTGEYQAIAEVEERASAAQFEQAGAGVPHLQTVRAGERRLG